MIPAKRRRRAKAAQGAAEAHPALRRSDFTVFFFQAEDGIRDGHVTGVQTCALPISDLASLIHDKTEGHPLFAINLLQYLSEHGDIGRTNAHWSLIRPLAELDLEAPESVRSMISKKIDALEAEERRTLQYASVEGTEFLSTVVAGLLGVDE